MSQDCIFCKIIKGEIPSFTVYEDDLVKVILDRFPAAPGHSLIIPKKHAADLFELPEETAAHILPLAKKLGAEIVKLVGAEGMNIVQNNGEAAGQSVHHFHLHMIPRKTGDNVILNQSSNTETTIEELEAVLRKLQG